MNDERFLLFQNSIDEDLLEEAQNYHKQKSNWGRYAALAACFCAVIAGVIAWHPWKPFRMGAAVPAAGVYEKTESAAEQGALYSTYAAPEAAVNDFSAPAAEMPLPEPAESYEEEADTFYAQRNDSAMAFGAAADNGVESPAEFGASAATAMPNPVRECTLEELAEIGYDMTLPFGAEPVFSARIGELAEVRFIYEGCEYMLRALKTAQNEDISGVYDSVRRTLNWSDSACDYEIHEGSEGIVFSWYSSVEGMQWCLFSRDAVPEAIMKTAGEIRGSEIPVPEE
ncbi:MAG: hypothetical protein K5771_05010 [Oscillospiraceae bacterium]|nr:hypothetical protein [Oscillospiraceae bacterium]